MHQTQPNKAKRVNVVTLGCSKNQVDSEYLMGQLIFNGVDAISEAKFQPNDVVVVNTCGFIESAKQESINTILEAVDAKKSGKIEKVIVTGCLSHRYREELAAEIPGVDAFYGSDEYQKVAKTLIPDYKKELIGQRVLNNPSHFAYLKISEGCDRPCSFCAIPIMRGKHKSKSIKELVIEAQKLAELGVKELILIAQDSTFYGLDIYGERKLADLCTALCQVNGIEWIRLHYAYPSQFPAKLLDVMSKEPKMCKYLDIPIQHSSEKMLKYMRRGISAHRLESLLYQIREKVPNIAIRTTVMVGHPGENQKEFEHLLDFIKKFKFDRLGVFEYSPEEGTHSFTLNDDIPNETKKKRASLIMEEQQTISLELNSKKINKQFKVLVDRIEGNTAYARTEFDSPEVDNEVIIQNGSHLHAGDFKLVKVTDALEFDLIANCNNP
tara:strand:- start:1992 stop:3308 length:1317 start_codon:yes stop_codon:yes gene_type:complete